MTDKIPEELNDDDLSNVKGGIGSNVKDNKERTPTKGLGSSKGIQKPGTKNMEWVHEDE